MGSALIENVGMVPPPERNQTSPRPTVTEIPIAAAHRDTAPEAAGELRDILSRGNGSDRQLRIFNANRDIVEVVSEIADATEVAAVPVSAH